MGCSLPNLTAAFKLPPLPFAIVIPKIPSLPALPADLTHGLKLPALPGVDGLGNAIAGVAKKLPGMPELSAAFKLPPLPFAIVIPKIPSLPALPVPYCPFRD